MSQAVSYETMENLWDARRVAAYLACSTSFVFKAAEDGRLPCLRVGRLLRFEPAQVLAFARGETGKAQVLQLPVRR